MVFESQGSGKLGLGFATVRGIQVSLELARQLNEWVVPDIDEHLLLRLKILIGSGPLYGLHIGGGGDGRFSFVYIYNLETCSIDS